MKVVLQDIVADVSRATKLTLPDAQIVVRKLITSLEESLENGQRIEIRDFGVFQTKTVSGKKGRDLTRNLSMYLPDYRKVSFKAGKNLRRLFWNLAEEAETPAPPLGQLEIPLGAETGARAQDRKTG